MAKPSFTAIEMPGQITIASNPLLNLEGSADAMMRRLRCTPFEADFKDNPDEKLSDKLTTPEALSGILNWALVGLRRLQSRGKFDKDSDESRAMKLKMLEESNPLGPFIRDCCEFKEGVWVETQVLWRAYEQHCNENGMEMIEQRWFFRRLRDAADSAGAKVDNSRGSVRDNGARPRTWKGIRLNADYRVIYYKHDPLAVELFGCESDETIMKEPGSGAPIPDESADLDDFAP
jgi:putative DNA primase/helicase